MDAGKKAIGKLVTSPTISTSAVTQYKLTVDANEGGCVTFANTSLTRRSIFYIYRSAGTEVTVIAEPNDGYEFSGWSNGFRGNPITFKLNSDIDFSAEFRTTDD
tara:strand:- start:401 stop:712 length:312 start_codon:yes stop_codon:yes gene_type:complete